MFERFSGEARDSVIHAQQAARELGHEQIGVEHVLFAILINGSGPGARALTAAGVTADRVRGRLVALHGRPGDGLDGDALAAVGIDLDEVRRAAEETFGPGALDRARPAGGRGHHLPFSPTAKKSLELALREALRLKQTSIRDGHLVLGMIRADPNLATRILADLGVDLADLREAIVRELSAQAA